MTPLPSRCAMLPPVATKARAEPRAAWVGYWAGLGLGLGPGPGSGLGLASHFPKTPFRRRSRSDPWTLFLKIDVSLSTFAICRRGEKCAARHGAICPYFFLEKEGRGPELWSVPRSSSVTSCRAHPSDRTAGRHGRNKGQTPREGWPEGLDSPLTQCGGGRSQKYRVLPATFCT